MSEAAVVLTTKRIADSISCTPDFTSTTEPMIRAVVGGQSMSTGNSMIFYRYEMEDGGGPFFTRDGVMRTDMDNKSDDNTISVCASTDALNKWFDDRQLPTDCFILRKYHGIVVHTYSSGEILIQRDSAIRL